MTNVVMSHKESDRIDVLEKLNHKLIKQKKAAGLMGLSVRQTRRLIKKYRQGGVKALVHGNRGRESNRKINQRVIDQALSLVRDKYADFGPTLAQEKLSEIHGLKLGVDTLRVNMIRANLWQPRRRKQPVIHQFRLRREMEGELVQVDGSPHDWFEGRIDPSTGQAVGVCSLLVFIDDATGKLLWLEFAKSESTNSYLLATKHYLQIHGKPVCLYSDKHGVFRVNTTSNGSSDLDDPKALTQFGRAMETLGISIICANSPQAKGRVEKVNQTLQDRLVKELRLVDISSIPEANKYLPEFIKAFNHKFAVIPKSSINAHRPLLPTDNLDLILCQHHHRTLSKNLTCQYHNQIYQILTQRPRYAMRHSRVEVVEDPLGQITILYQNQPLKFTTYQLPVKANVIDSKLINLVVDEISPPLQPQTQTLWEEIAEVPYQDYVY